MKTSNVLDFILGYIFALRKYDIKNKFCGITFYDFHPEFVVKMFRNVICFTQPFQFGKFSSPL